MITEKQLKEFKRQINEIKLEDVDEMSMRIGGQLTRFEIYTRQ